MTKITQGEFMFAIILTILITILIGLSGQIGGASVFDIASCSFILVMAAASLDKENDND